MIEDTASRIGEGQLSEVASQRPGWVATNALGQITTTTDGLIVRDVIGVGQTISRCSSDNGVTQDGWGVMCYEGESCGSGRKCVAINTCSNSLGENPNRACKKDEDCIGGDTCKIDNEIKGRSPFAQCHWKLRPGWNHPNNKVKWNECNGGRKQRCATSKDCDFVSNAIDAPHYNCTAINLGQEGDPGEKDITQWDYHHGNFYKRGAWDAISFSADYLVELTNKDEQGSIQAYAEDGTPIETDNGMVRDTLWILDIEADYMNCEELTTPGKEPLKFEVNARRMRSITTFTHRLAEDDEPVTGGSGAGATGLYIRAEPRSEFTHTTTHADEARNHTLADHLTPTNTEDAEPWRVSTIVIGSVLTVLMVVYIYNGCSTGVWLGNKGQSLDDNRPSVAKSFFKTRSEMFPSTTTQLLVPKRMLQPGSRKKQ